MDRLINTIALAFAVRNTAQASAGKQTDAARNDGSLVADDVTEQVAGDDNAVQSRGLLDHEHSGAVNQLIGELQLGKLLLEDLMDNFPPQTTGGEHVCLVQTPDLRRRGLLHSQKASKAGNPLNLMPVVWLGVHGETGSIILCPVTKVYAARKLAYDNEVGATADLSLQRRTVDQTVGGKAAGAQVAEGSHLFAQLQETLLRADRANTPFWATDGTKQDSIGRFGSLEGLVGQGGLVDVD